MSFEANENLDLTYQSREVGIEELDGLVEAIENMGPSQDPSGDDPSPEELIFEYAATFLSDRELELMGMASEQGSFAPNSNEYKKWHIISRGKLRHPAVVGTLARLAGLDDLKEAGEERWKDLGACRSDKRFVKSGRKKTREKEELKAICEGCPVFEQCSAYVQGNKVTKGFWAAQQRTDKNN